MYGRNSWVRRHTNTTFKLLWVLDSTTGFYILVFAEEVFGAGDEIPEVVEGRVGLACPVGVGCYGSVCGMRLTWSSGWILICFPEWG